MPPSGLRRDRGVRDTEPKQVAPRTPGDAFDRTAADAEAYARSRKGPLRKLAAIVRLEESRLRRIRGISQLRLSVIQAKDLISDAPYVACETSLTLAKSMKS